MSDSSRLPARPSLEQLQKQAKELLRESRAAGAPGGPATLAEAQFLLARKYGFESWAKLKHHIESTRPQTLERFERLAADLAAAYASGNSQAVREINWRFGTEFLCDFHDPARMREYADGDTARAMVARFYGHDTWTGFMQSFTVSEPKLYRIDRAEDRLMVNGPVSDRDWESVCDNLNADQITGLSAPGITDEGLRRLERAPFLEELELSNPRGSLTDRGLAVLRNLPNLRKISLCWQPKITDAGIANLGYCELLEDVDLMGTHTGDTAIRALAGKARLRYLKTGREVTDAVLPMLHQFPVFKTWQGGEASLDLMSFAGGPNHLMIDGPFTNAGLARLVGLDGLYGLSFFWHSNRFTGAGLAPLKELPQLGFLGCQDKRCDDEAMREIAGLPHLRMLMAQGSVASDGGFQALSRSQSIERIWGRACPNLTSRGFAALASMPALRGLAVSCKRVDDATLALLPRFPALTELLPMDVSDGGFRHVGRCENLESLWCMYCRDTGDAATGHIAGLAKLRLYYAGQTRITDRSLELLARMGSLEDLEFWACSGITDAGVAGLAILPRLREIRIGGCKRVTRGVISRFPAHVRVQWSG
jgi:hypothetical protein